MPIPERGDLYHIEVAKGEILGHELWGPHWWVVLSFRTLNQAFRLFTAVPLSSVINKQTGEPKDKGNFRYFHIRILESAKHGDPGQDSPILKGDSIALTEQVRVFSDQRISAPRVGIVSPEALGAIEAGVLFVIGAGIGRQTGEASVAPQPAPKPVSLTEAPKPVPSRPVKP